MAGLLRLGVGFALVGMLAVGCGRTATEPANPANSPVEFEQVSGSGQQAHGIVTDMGNTLAFRVTGNGFGTSNIYSIVPLRSYVAGSPVGFQIERDVIPEPVPVTSDGQIQVVTSFQHRGATTPANRWVAVGLLYHPNGDAADTRNAQLLLVGPLPSDLY